MLLLGWSVVSHRVIRHFEQDVQGSKEKSEEIGYVPLSAFPLYRAAAYFVIPGRSNDDRRDKL